MSERDGDLISFRCYYQGGWVSEGRRQGLDPVREQLKALYKLMAAAVPDTGNDIEVVMTVRPVEQ